MLLSILVHLQFVTDAYSYDFQLTSLPAKLTNGVDLPTFGSPTRSRNPPNNLKDGIAASNGNGLGSSDSHLSRFSTQAGQRKESKNDLKPHYRQSLLSQEFSNLSLSDNAEKGSNMKQDISISEVSPGATNGQFHFSIYKWASKGVPLVMPLRTERNSRTKDKAKLERCLSAKEWMVSEITSQNPIAYDGSSLINNRKRDESTASTTTQNGVDSHQIVDKIVSAKAQSDTSSSPQTVTEHVPNSSISCDVAVESNTHSASDIGFSGKIRAARETQKHGPKPLHSLFKESDKKQDCGDMIRRVREENRRKSAKKLSSIFDVTVNAKKQEEKTLFWRDIENSKATSRGALSFGGNVGNGRVKGKVKEFVRIFNEEALTKPIVESKSRLQHSTFKQRDALKTKDEVDGEDDPKQYKMEKSTLDTTNTSGNDLSHQVHISASAVPDISFAVIGDREESVHENFMIQVLAQDEGEVLQNQENQEIQVVDTKIQQWSKGKEANIRSLLSTLQYVLWPECGWKPVPLVDIIEGNAVKRSYQRALLCLHPDKLQQKGAASHQKYIAEKVFDILQVRELEVNDLFIDMIYDNIVIHDKAWMFYSNLAMCRRNQLS
ncbi:hypothetical protein RJT34_08679 [Clitoria ternatea]|uniref:Uncharacterized protein n=1 Tax=Clitoria ternatea TaxID=43366 RepID=A0AAN9PV07_CLITE